MPYLQLVRFGRQTRPPLSYSHLLYNRCTMVFWKTTELQRGREGLRTVLVQMVAFLFFIIFYFSIDRSLSIESTASPPSDRSSEPLETPIINCLFRSIPLRRHRSIPILYLHNQNKRYSTSTMKAVCASQFFIWFILSISRLMYANDIEVKCDSIFAHINNDEVRESRLFPDQSDSCFLEKQLTLCLARVFRMQTSQDK